MAKSTKLSVFLHRVRNVEYWPFWILYGPFIPKFLYYGLRNGSILHFLSINPGVQNSGCFNYSKYSLLKQLPKEFIPETILLESEEKKITFNPTDYDLDYPIIVKPDRGNRGRGVVLVRNQKELKSELDKNYDILVQEYNPHPYEYGVFYYHNQKTGEKGITGLTSKRYLEVEGNGVLTLKEILEQHPRAKPGMSHFSKKFSTQWNVVLPLGKQLVIEEIGAHSRGTECTDQTALITPTMEQLFFDLADQMEGFYWGRIDVKVSSPEALQKGENIHIIEVNGGSSEPSHMFDPQYNWFDVSRVVNQHLKLHFGVVKANLENGEKIPSLSTFISEVKLYFANKKLQTKQTRL